MATDQAIKAALAAFYPANGGRAWPLVSMEMMEKAIHASRDAEAALIADMVVEEVQELPDRTSPDDWPDAMLVTGDELRKIVIACIVSTRI
jgi:hypothetical protein